MKLYPALDVCGAAGAADTVLVAVDDFSPTAVEERDSALRVFFTSAAARDAACAQLRGSGYDTHPLDVSDEDWARRSQGNLQPVRVGRLLVAPHPFERHDVEHGASALTMVIPASMGFGTGHHATTRLCLEMLQQIDLSGRSVLDVGTGSGILAIAADRLGASRVLGIDCDPDALHAARENLALNPAAQRTSFEVADLDQTTLAPVDVVTANLTGALLLRAAAPLQRAVRAGGALALSGILSDERDGVARAFAGGTIAWERRDDEWVGLLVKKS